MNWQAKIEDVLDQKIVTINKQFSRRNQVFLIEIDNNGQQERYIYKQFASTLAENEVLNINNVIRQGVRVPNVIWHDDNSILMEYINGVLLADLVAEQHTSDDIWVEQLAKWLYKLHGIKSDKQKCLCLSDLNLRNFIFADGEFYGIDFEELCFSQPEKDIGGICAFILNNDPMFTSEKYNLCNKLIKSYQKCNPSNELDYQAIKYYLLEELIAAAQRRAKRVGANLAKGMT